MKKAYIYPKNRVAEIDCCALIADSPVFNSGSNAGSGGGNDNENDDATNYGDGLARGQRIWDTEW